MKQSIVSRLGRIEAARQSRSSVGRNKALTDARVRQALATITVEDALINVPIGYAGERTRAVIEAAYRADH